MYGSLSAANAYHLARNNTEWAGANDTVKNGALQRATDYIDSTYRSRFPGTKTGGRAQLLSWPRTGVIDADSQTIADNEVPIEVESATYEAAFLIVKGIELNPVTQSGSVKRERVKSGPVESETEYADDAETYSSFAIIDNLLANILGVASGTEYELLRA